jgi:hypothetical protein
VKPKPGPLGQDFYFTGAGIQIGEKPLISIKGTELPVGGQENFGLWI